MNKYYIHHNINTNPYGMTFENQYDTLKQEKNKYKEDLDYLNWLKQSKKDDDQRQRILYADYLNKQIELQNDKFNEKTKENRNLQMEIQKSHLNDMYINRERRLIDRSNEIQKEKNDLEYVLRDKNKENFIHDQERNKWKHIADNELNNFNKQKEDQLKKKAIDDDKYNTYIQQRNKEFILKEKEYKDKFSNINNKIYNNLMTYSDYLHNNNIKSLDEPFHLRNDNELNRHIANKRDYEKLFLKKDASGNAAYLAELDKLKDLENKEKAIKSNEKALYKNFLDKQYFDLQNQKNKKDTFVPQLLLPSYHYPNRPVPLYKKAADSIHLVKNNILFENQNVGDMKEFFQHEVQSHTLLDQNDSRSYYNPYGSNLNHNPIVNPIPSFDSNKYINKLAKSDSLVKPRIRYDEYCMPDKEEKTENKVKNNNTVTFNEDKIYSYPEINNNELHNDLVDHHNEYNNYSTDANRLNYNNQISDVNNNKEQNQQYSNSNQFSLQHNQNENEVIVESKRNGKTIQSLDSNKNIINNKIGNKLISKLKERLKIKGVQGMHFLKDYFDKLDKQNTYLLDFNQFQSFYKDFIGSNYEEIREAFQYFDDMQIGKIKYEEILSLIKGDLPEIRKNLIVNLFNSLSSNTSGKYVEESIIKEKFNTRYHPDVISYKKTDMDVLTDFLNDFNLYFYKNRVGIIFI